MCVLGPSHKCEYAQHTWLRISVSVLVSILARYGKIRPISNTGRGWPSHKLLIVQVKIRSSDRRSHEVFFRLFTSGVSAPALSTRSLVAAPSPAKLPRTHTDCSSTYSIHPMYTQTQQPGHNVPIGGHFSYYQPTSSLDESNNETSVGTTPFCNNTDVLSVAPAAIFVSAHSAST